MNPKTYPDHNISLSQPAILLSKSPGTCSTKEFPFLCTTYKVLSWKYNYHFHRHLCLFYIVLYEFQLLFSSRCTCYLSKINAIYSYIHLLFAKIISLAMYINLQIEIHGHILILLLCSITSLSICYPRKLTYICILNLVILKFLFLYIPDF